MLVDRARVAMRRAHTLGRMTNMHKARERCSVDEISTRDLWPIKRVRSSMGEIERCCCPIIGGRDGATDQGIEYECRAAGSALISAPTISRRDRGVPFVDAGPGSRLRQRGRLRRCSRPSQPT